MAELTAHNFMKTPKKYRALMGNVHSYSISCVCVGGGGAGCLSFVVRGFFIVFVFFFGMSTHQHLLSNRSDHCHEVGPPLSALDVLPSGYKLPGNHI